MEFEPTEEMPKLTIARAETEGVSPTDVQLEQLPVEEGEVETLDENIPASDSESGADLDTDSQDEIDAEAEGADFLLQIEARHNQVLDDLNDLNSKIETVLEDFLKQQRADTPIEAADRRSA
ncbi:MAG: hypothetical protein AB8B50_18440 [Pirellulaceae bacterium]